MESAVAPLIFGCVFLLVLGLATVLRPRTAKDRLASLSAKAPVAGVKGVKGPSLVRGEETGLLGFFSRLGSRKEKKKEQLSQEEAIELGQFRQRFVHAGYQRPSAPAIFYGIRITLALALPAFASLMPVVWGLLAWQQIVLMGVLTALGYLGPSVFLNSRASRRQLSITRALPDALDLLVVCVEAGLGINQGLARVAEEFRTKSPPLSYELGLVGAQTRAGKTTTQALRGLAERTGVSDVGSLVALLVQTERFGTSVANVLRVHADAMRVRRMQRAEERAQLATLKLILPSTMIFGALLMVFLAPGMYAFFGAFSGIE